MKPFLKLIAPEKAEVVVFLSVSLALLIIENIQKFWLLLGGKDANTLSDTGDFATQFGNWYLNNIEAKIDPRFIDFLVWMLIGCVVFALFEYIVVQVRSTDEEISLLHDTRSQKSRASEFRTYIARLAVRIAGIIGFLLWFALFTGTLNKGLANLFFVNASTLNQISSWLWVVLSVIAMAVTLYVFAIFARIIALRPRVFGEGEEV
ncbi:MAG: hypothetical protein U0491_02215 [Candidatus Saccharimonadales bacterium]